jgi:hypothetical protein
MYQASFQQAQLPISSKQANVHPLSTKQTLDPYVPHSYQPISNLSFVLKVVEKVVNAKPSNPPSKYNLLPVIQPA